MTPAEAATILRQFNEWRRGDEDIPQFDPREIGEAIDAAVEMIDHLEAAESEAIEQARLNGVGGERELALMARVEAAERKVGLLERLLDAKRKDHAVIQEQNSVLRAEIDNIKEVQFDLKVKAVAEGWRGKCERLEKERNALRAKIEAMERLITWVKDECRLYPDSLDEKAFADRLLAAITHPKSGIQGAHPGAKGE